MVRIKKCVGMRNEKKVGREGDLSHGIKRHSGLSYPFEDEVYLTTAKTPRNHHLGLSAMVNDGRGKAGAL